VIFDFGACIVSIYSIALAIWVNQRNAVPLRFWAFEENVVQYAPLSYQTHADSRVVEGMYLELREAFQFKSRNRRYPAMHQVNILQQKND
jgi:hypothetical protein